MKTQYYLPEQKKCVEKAIKCKHKIRKEKPSQLPHRDNIYTRN